MKPGAGSHWNGTWDAIVREAYRQARGEHAIAIPLVRDRLPAFDDRRIRRRAVALKVTAECQGRAVQPEPGPRKPEPEVVVVLARVETGPLCCPRCKSIAVFGGGDGFRSCLMCGTTV